MGNSAELTRSAAECKTREIARVGIAEVERERGSRGPLFAPSLGFGAQVMPALNSRPRAVVVSRVAAAFQVASGPRCGAGFAPASAKVHIAELQLSRHGFSRGGPEGPGELYMNQQGNGFWRSLQRRLKRFDAIADRRMEAEEDPDNLALGYRTFAARYRANAAEARAEAERHGGIIRRECFGEADGWDGAAARLESEADELDRKWRSGTAQKP